MNDTRIPRHLPKACPQRFPLQPLISGCPVAAAQQTLGGLVPLGLLQRALADLSRGAIHVSGVWSHTANESGIARINPTATLVFLGDVLTSGPERALEHMAHEVGPNTKCVILDLNLANRVFGMPAGTAVQAVETLTIQQAHYVLSSPHYPKGDGTPAGQPHAFRIMDDLLNGLDEGAQGHHNVLTMPGGPGWEKVSKPMSKGLKGSKMPGWMNHAKAVADRLVTSLAAKKQIDLFHFFKDATLKISTNVIFGQDYTSCDGAEEFQKALEGVFSESEFRFRVPWWERAKALFTKREATYERNIRIVRDFIARRVNECREKPENDNLISTLLDLMDGPEETRPFQSIPELISTLLLILIAAHDTTAAALTYFFNDLSQNEKTMAAIHNEVKKKSDFRKLADYPTLRISFEESLAKTPPISIIVRKKVVDPQGLSREDRAREIELFGIEIPSGADLFIPVRYVNAQTSDPKLQISFGAGERRCPGEPVAYMVFSIIAHTLIRSRISLEPIAHERQGEMNGITRNPKNYRATVHHGSLIE